MAPHREICTPEGLKELGCLVREARRSKRLSQAKIAKLAFISSGAISEIENGWGTGTRGENICNTYTIQRLAEILELDADRLMAIAKQGKQADEAPAPDEVKSSPPIASESGGKYSVTPARTERDNSLPITNKPIETESGGATTALLDRESEIVAKIAEQSKLLGLTGLVQAQEAILQSFREQLATNSGTATATQKAFSEVKSDDNPDIFEGEESMPRERFDSSESARLLAAFRATVVVLGGDADELKRMGAKPEVVGLLNKKDEGSSIYEVTSVMKEDLDSIARLLFIPDAQGRATPRKFKDSDDLLAWVRQRCPRC